MLRKYVYRFGLILLLAVMVTGLGVTISFAVPYDTIKGTISDPGKPWDTTPWAVVKPTTGWNGTIILDLDGSSVGNVTDFSKFSATIRWLLDHGYAYGGTNRNLVAYNFPQAVENLVTVRSKFIGQYGATPWRTIAWGSSRGGFVGRLCMELRPDIFDAAIVMAGGGAGEISTLNRFLDSGFVLKTLVDPTSPLKIVGVPNNSAATSAETAAQTALVKLADSTPAGQARLALAAAMAQFSAWTVSGTPQPAADDYTAQYAQLVAPAMGTLNFVFANPIVVRAPIEQLAGGVVSWNNGVNYTDMLARSGRADFVKAMYERAGISLQEDLKILKNAPRIIADPNAVAIAEKLMSYTGEIFGPVMNVDNIGDPVDPSPAKVAYRHTLNRAGNEKLFKLSWIQRAGHGGQSDLERVSAFVTLINRLDSGKWGDTSAAGMNALAQEINAEWPNFPLTATTPLFMEYNGVSQALRPWDASDWDTYVPCAGYQPGKSFNSCK